MLLLSLQEIDRKTGSHCSPFSPHFLLHEEEILHIRMFVDRPIGISCPRPQAGA